MCCTDIPKARKAFIKKLRNSKKGTFSVYKLLKKCGNKLKSPFYDYTWGIGENKPVYGFYAALLKSQIPNFKKMAKMWSPELEEDIDKCVLVRMTAKIKDIQFLGISGMFSIGDPGAVKEVVTTSLTLSEAEYKKAMGNK